MRLPPPVRPSSDPQEWYDSRGSYDGSVSMLPPEQGGPVMLYDAMHGLRPNGTLLTSGAGDDPGWLAVARPKNASDPYLVEWVKDPRNPVWFDLGDGTSSTGQVGGAVFPSTIWKSGDHFNFLSKGDRYVTRNPTFLNWTLVRSNSSQNPDGRFMREGSAGTGQARRGEEGGAWFVRLPNTTEGEKPPKGSPTHAANIFVGNQFALGDYDSCDLPCSTSKATRLRFAYCVMHAPEMLNAVESQGGRKLDAAPDRSQAGRGADGWLVRRILRWRSIDEHGLGTPRSHPGCCRTSEQPERSGECATCHASCCCSAVLLCCCAAVLLWPCGRCSDLGDGMGSSQSCGRFAGIPHSNHW
eukprot:SAG25_NODE_490_length_7426_cov_3.764706_8_plen_355_part_00